MYGYTGVNPLRRFALLVFVALSTALGACDSTTPEEEPDVAVMRLIAGTKTIDINAATGAVSGGPFTIPVGSTTISAQFLLADGTPEPLVTSATFRLDVSPANPAIVSFARTGPFTGTLTGVGAGQSTSVTFGLFHLDEGHEEFEWPVVIQVQ